MAIKMCHNLNNSNKLKFNHAIWRHLVTGSCHPLGLVDFFSLFNCLFSSAFFEAFSYRSASSNPELYSCNIFSSSRRSLDRCQLYRDSKWWSLLRLSRIPVWHGVWLCRTWVFWGGNPIIGSWKTSTCPPQIACIQ